MSTVKEIETLAERAGKNTLIKLGFIGESTPEPLATKPEVEGRIIKIQEKLQPTNAESSSKGWTSPLTQDGPLETWDPVLHVDSTGLLTFLILPLKTAKFKTADAVPSPVQFNFTQPPQP